MFTNPEALPIPSSGILMEVSLYKHDWLTHWLLVLIQPPASSPPWKSMSGTDNYNPLIRVLPWSLKKAFLSLLAIRWNSAFKWIYLSFSPFYFASPLFTAIYKASSDSHFAFLHFFFGRMVLILSPVQFHEPPTIVHQALCLSDLNP